MFKANKKGFTLIELLIVIGIISILAGIVLVAVNPAVQFGKANDSERKSEIGTILSAIYQYQTSPTARGSLPQCVVVGGTAMPIPACGTNFATALELGTDTGLYNCATALIPSYLREIPIDPNDNYNSAAHTGYFVCQQTVDSVSRVYVLAPSAEVYKTDGDCQMLRTPDGETTPAAVLDTMCVSG